MRKGWIVELAIRDHAITKGSAGPEVVIMVYGVITKVTRKTIDVTHWRCMDQSLSHNNEVATLVRSAIITWRRLR